MPEMRRPVPETDFRRQPDFRGKFRLERVDIEGAQFSAGVQVEIDVAQAAYSTVAKPWLKVRAASSRCRSASGKGSPVW